MILIVSAVFPPEQVTSAYLNFDLAKELAKRYEVTVLRPYPTRPIGAKFISADVWDNSFKTIILKSYVHPQSELFGRFRESIDFGRKCAAYIEEKHQEISLIYNDCWQLFGLYIVAKVANKYKIPYVTPIQDIYPECLFTNKKYPQVVKRAIKGILLPIDKYYQRNAACIRTISDEMRDYLSSTRHIPEDHYLVVNNWQNDEDYMRDYPARPNDGKLIFAFVGSINGHANVELMIKAFDEAKIDNAEFRIYGGGNKKDYCVDLVKQLGAKNIFFDLVSREKVAFVQSQVDVLVLALPKGNGNLCLPSKMTSYMLSGKPVLASVDEDSSTTRFIHEARCGISVAPNDIIAIKNGFLKFASFSKKELNEQGRNGRQFALETLTREVNLTKVVDRINDVLKKSKYEIERNC